MEKLKQITALLVTLLAAFLGYGEAPEMAVNLGAVLAIVYALTAVAKPYIGGTWIQIFSWGIGVIVCLTFWLAELGIFAGETLTFAIISGIAVALVANGVYKVGILNLISKGV